jgi:hypothetical protein
MMTGFYVRVLRDGLPQNVDIAALTDFELEALPKPPAMGWPWAVGLARWIRDNVRAVPVPEELPHG